MYLEILVFRDIFVHLAYALILVETLLIAARMC